jgi:aminopeptidase YwaD
MSSPVEAIPAQKQPLADEAMTHVHRLAGDIGNRTMGSPGNHAAADYIADIFKSAGLAVEFQAFPCPDWAEEFTLLELEGEKLDAAANAFSPSCDVTAPTVAIGTLGELEAADIAARIPIFYGDLAQHELAAKGAIYVSERDRKIISLLERRSPTGLITINPTVNARWRLIEDYDLAIPSVTVTARSGLKLLEHAGQNVHMRIVAHRAPSHSANVIGRLPGERPEQIVLCAHYDTKVDTPGAYDNAAGVAVLLTLAQTLAKTPHRYTLEWVAFSGEEVYGLGDMEYARRTGDGFDQILAAINFDGVGPRLAANTIATFSASEAFAQLVSRLSDQYPGVAPVAPWPASDHYIFYSHGVPSLALSSVGIKDIYHTPADTVDWISPDKLAETVMLGQDLVNALDEQELAWCRPK